MPPLRRSIRRKCKKSTAVDEERYSNRESKRRETLSSNQIQSPWFKNMLQALLPSIVSGLLSDDCKLQLDAIAQLVKLLSVEVDPPIDKVTKSGAVPRLVELLGGDNYPQLQCEGARVLKNITSGTSENTNVVIDCGAIPVLVRLLESPSDEAREQAAWALGNIAGDSPRSRDLVLSSGALGPLLTLLNDHNKLSLLRIGIWTLSNLCQGNPEPPFEQLESALPILASLILTDDVPVLTEACWAVSYLSQGENGQKKAVIEAGLCANIMKLLLHPSPSVVFPALRMIAAILRGNVEQAKHACDCQARFYISSLLRKEEHSTNTRIIKEADITMYLYQESLIRWFHEMKGADM